MAQLRAGRGARQERRRWRGEIGTHVKSYGNVSETNQGIVLGLTSVMRRIFSHNEHKTSSLEDDLFDEGRVTEQEIRQDQVGIEL